ncbi:MAG: hypothetical protein ACFFDH_03985 [Promethearchaeota archaeon]
MSFIPIIFNIKSLLGIGHFSFDQTYVSDYPEGRVGINVKVSISHVHHTQCSGTVEVKTISDGNIEMDGITRISFTVRTEGRATSGGSTEDNPAKICIYGFSINIVKDDNVSCIGNVDIKYDLGGSEQIERFNFDVSYIIPIEVSDIYYNWDIPLIWVDVLYFVIIGVVFILVLRKYRHVRHASWYSEDIKKRDEEFHEFLSKRNQEEKE